MATFGKDLDLFQQIASGNMAALKDLVASSADLVRQNRAFQVKPLSVQPEPAPGKTEQQP
jgi:hypothetical protein